MKRFVFEVTDEYAKKLNDQKVIEHGINDKFGNQSSYNLWIERCWKSKAIHFLTVFDVL